MLLYLKNRLTYCGDGSSSSSDDFRDEGNEAAMRLSEYSEDEAAVAGQAVAVSVNDAIPAVLCASEYSEDKAKAAWYAVHDTIAAKAFQAGAEAKEK